MTYHFAAAARRAWSSIIAMGVWRSSLAFVILCAATTAVARYQGTIDANGNPAIWRK